MLTRNSAPSAKANRMARLAPLALILVLVVVFTTLAVNVWFWLLPARARVPAPEQENAAQGPKLMQSIRFTLYDVGILPRQVRAPQGRVAISIEDRSGGSPGVMIERLEGTQQVAAGQVQRAEDGQRGRQEMELQPGTYRVSMIDRPENNATLVVEP